MAQQKSKLFHCYVSGNIFKIATATKVQEFGFSGFESEEDIVGYLETAIGILKETIPNQLILTN